MKECVIKLYGHSRAVLSKGIRIALQGPLRDEEYSYIRQRAGLLLIGLLSERLSFFLVWSSLVFVLL